MEPLAPEDQSHGELLLTAVERLVDDPENLIAEVETLIEEAHAAGETRDHGAVLHEVAARIISAYSTKSAIAGAVTALPAILPGGGTLLAVVGGSLADMGLVLKHEVEMVLSLAHLYGHDIRDERKRWLAYVLAAVSTYEAQSGRNYFVDLAEAELEAIVKYTPRQLSKLVVSAMAKIALLSLTKRSLIRALPLVGVVIGGAANKLMTGSVGWRSAAALARLHRAGGGDERRVVDARVT